MGGLGTLPFGRSGYSNVGAVWVIYRLGGLGTGTLPFERSWVLYRLDGLGSLPVGRSAYSTVWAVRVLHRLGRFLTVSRLVNGSVHPGPRGRGRRVSPASALAQPCLGAAPALPQPQRCPSRCRRPASASACISPAAAPPQAWPDQARASPSALGPPGRP